jgi:hypothetical protein
MFISIYFLTNHDSGSKLKIYCVDVVMQSMGCIYLLEGDVMLNVNGGTKSYSNALGETVSTAPVKKDLRGTQPPLPNNLFYYLNNVQQQALKSLEAFGWRLAFIRRPLFMTPLVVVSNRDDTQLAVLEEDGSVNISSQIQWRH